MDSEEPRTTKAYNDLVSLRLGKNSGRVYAVEFDLDEMKKRGIELKIVLPTALKEMTERNRHDRSLYFDTVYGAISANEPELLSPEVPLTR